MFLYKDWALVDGNEWKDENNWPNGEKKAKKFNKSDPRKEWR